MRVEVPDERQRSREVERLPTDIPICFMDRSWQGLDTRNRQGWIDAIGDRILHLGLKGSRRCLSPLYVEHDALVWAMKSLISIDLTDVIFAMDCSDFLDMTSNSEDWQSFASELPDFMFYRDSFMSFRIRLIPPSENVRVDHLVKCARTCGFCFSHVNTSIPIN